MKRRANGEGTIYRDGAYWVAELTRIDGAGTWRRQRRKRKTQREAVEALEKLRHDRNFGIDKNAQRQRTVATVCETYLEQAKERVQPRTCRDYERICNQFIVPVLGRMRPGDIRRKDIDDVLERVNGKRQKQLVYVVARAILRLYVLHADPVDYPFPIRRTPKVDRREPLAMDLAQIHTFISMAKNEPLGPLYILAITTGMRQGEILGLRWRDIGDTSIAVAGSLEEGSREHSPTKTGRTRKIDMPPEAIRVLTQIRKTMRRPPRRDDYVFTTAHGKPFSASHIRNEWRRARERLGLEKPVRFYDLRHAHATALLAAGIHIKIVSERLGHASTRLTMDTYSHVLPGMQQGAMDAVARLFMEPVPPKITPKARNTKTRRPAKR